MESTRKVLNPGPVYGGVRAPYSSAISAGGWVFASASGDINAETGEVGVADPVSPFRTSSLNNESRKVLGAVEHMLDKAGCDMRTDVVRLHNWLVTPRPNLADFESSTSVRNSVTVNLHSRNFPAFLGEPRPASTAMGVRELLVPNSGLALDAVAIPDSKGREKLRYDPQSEAKPAGAYSPALVAGDWVFLSGAMATDFAGDYMSSQNMGAPSALAPGARLNPYVWYGSPVAAQVEYILTYLKAAAEAAGTTLERCVKADVYIGHPRDWYEVDQVWQRWFPDNPPARVVVPLLGTGAEGCSIEIAMTLLSGDSTLTKETVHAPSVAEPFGHEPHAVKAGNLLFLSTQLPVDSAGALAEGTQADDRLPYFPAPAEQQMKLMLQNIDEISRAAGTTLANACRFQGFFDDLSDFSCSIREWGRHFPESPPVFTPIRVGGPLLVPGAHALLDVIAYAP